jgi:hypothetical protein
MGIISFPEVPRLWEFYPIKKKVDEWEAKKSQLVHLLNIF